MPVHSLEGLRCGLRTARNYARFWIQYLDHFAAAPGFHERGQPLLDPRLEAVVTASAARRIGLSWPVRFFGLQMREIPEEGLVHGIGFLEGRLCTFLIDRLQGQGMLALASLADSHAAYARFSYQERPMSMSAAA
jgi:hypothetical protein